MGESGGLTLLVGVVVVAIVLQCAAAQTVYVVGDGIGWRIPTTKTAYADWASNKTFNVNDTLTFNFATNAHDVLQVPKASYEACTQDNAISAIITNGPANVTLTGTGKHYYICTIGQHCVNGQKLAINVSASTSAPTPGSPPTTTTPSATTSPPPPPSSSSSAVFASFFVALLPIAMGFFL